MTTSTPSRRPTVLCVKVSVGEFMDITLPAALYPALEMAGIIDCFEGLGQEPVVEYVWR